MFSAGPSPGELKASALSVLSDVKRARNSTHLLG